MMGETPPFAVNADVADVCRRAAGYIGRILKREKPADLPVQALTKYELASTSNGAEGPSTVLSAEEEPWDWIGQ